MFMRFFPEPASIDESGLSFQIRGLVLFFGMGKYFVTGGLLGSAPHSMS